MSRARARCNDESRAMPEKLRSRKAGALGRARPFAVGTSDREMEFRFEPVQRAAAYAIRISPLIESRWVREIRLYATDKIIAPTVTQAHYPSSEQLLYVWTPEGKPLDLHALDPESGFALPEWASFIMQIHYAGGHSLAKDQSGVEICMTAEARTKPMSISVVSAEGIPGSSSTMGICEPALTSPVDIMAILPHMRSRGHSMQVSLLREDGSEDKLHDDTFTYGEQQWLVRHATVAPKDRISVQCEYSEKVTFGFGLEYEVCHLYALTASADVLRNEKPLILPNTCVGLPGGF